MRSERPDPAWESERVQNPSFANDCLCVSRRSYRCRPLEQGFRVHSVPAGCRREQSADDGDDDQPLSERRAGPASSEAGTAIFLSRTDAGAQLPLHGYPPAGRQPSPLLGPTFPCGWPIMADSSSPVPTFC